MGENASSFTLPKTSSCSKLVRVYKEKGKTIEKVGEITRGRT